MCIRDRPKIVARPGPHSFMRCLSDIGCVQKASLGHIHKVTAVRQAGRRIATASHDEVQGRGPANLLTKGQAWHTHNIVRIGVLLPAHFPTDLLDTVSYTHLTLPTSDL